MDVLVPHIGEIIGGSQREERLDVLEARMARAEARPGSLLVVPRPPPVRHACPTRASAWASSGRVQFVTGMDNIRDVIPFPRTPEVGGTGLVLRYRKYIR